MTAAQRVTRKNPSLRTMNLMFRTSYQPRCSLCFGLRWRSITPQSGFSYAAGRANGSPFSTQPARSLVLYWYQSTPSVTGITGISFTITASSCLTIWCCFAESVVAAYCSIRASTCGFS